MSFSWLNAMEDRIWEHYRGAKLLWALQKDDAFSANDVQTIEGHTAVLCHNRSLLMVLDAVPEESQLDMDTSDRVQAAIAEGQANEDPNGVCAEKCPMFVLQRAAGEQDILRTFFGYSQDGSRLRLFALHQGGKLQAWCWFGTSSGLYKWRWMGTTTVSEGLTVRLRDARLTPAASMLVWWECDADDKEGMHGKGTKEELHQQQRLRLRKLSNMQRQLKERVCYQGLRFEVDPSVAEGSRDRVVVERLVSGEGEEHGKIACGYDSILQIEATQRRLWVLSEGRLASWLFGATTAQEVTWTANSNTSSSGVECVTEAVASGPSEGGPDRRESLLTLDRILAGGADSSPAAEASSAVSPDIGQAADTVRHVQRKRTTITGAVAIAANAASQDVLLLEPSGRVLVCRSTGGISGQVAVYYLCRLRGERDWGSVRKLIAHRHLLIILWVQDFIVCDPKTGLVVCEGSLPEGSQDCHLWESRLDVGLWQGKHIWRLLPCEATDYLEKLEALIESLPQDQRPVNYLASLSKSLGMVHTSSHYSLRELRRLCMPSEDAEDEASLPSMANVGGRRQSTFAATQNVSPLVMQKQQDIASELLRHLQNPALVLALLGSIKSHKQFLDTEVETFLNRYNGSQIEDKRLAETWRFLLHTPLNMTVVPLLEEWRKLSRQQASMSIGTGQGRDALPLEATDPTLEGLKKGEITWADLSEEEMVALSFEAPALLLAHLEEAFELLPKHFEPDTEERIPSSHPLLKSDSEGAFSSKRTEVTHIFDTMCSLYFTANPGRLLPFAELLQRSNPSGPRIDGGMSRSWLFQATLSLPDVSSLSFILGDGRDGERIDAVVRLYGQLGMRGHAMRMLLSLCLVGGAVDYWGRVDDLLAQTAGEAALLQKECDSNAKQLEHDEVFHIALTHCMEQRDNEHLQLVLKHRPERLKPLLLVETLENYLSPGECPRLEVLKQIGGATAEEVATASQGSNVPIVVEKDGQGSAFTVESFREQLAGMFQDG